MALNMSDGNDLKQKISGFLRWYQDLYDGCWYIEDPGGIRELQTDKMMTKIPGNSPGSGRRSPLQQFNKEIEHCTKCPLGHTRTRFVFGSGNENADIMFVGEAPGRDEDLQGIPFVGRGGQLLNQLLARVQLKREDVYIANILKCRPPNNRDPQPQEVSECLPYLHRQVELVQPKLLVALGRVAAQNLLNRQTSLTSLRRKVWRYRDIPMIVTFHPAYILRNMQMMNEAIDDMRLVITHSRQQGSPED